MKKRELISGNINWNKSKIELDGFKKIFANPKKELSEIKDIQKYLHKCESLILLIGKSMGLKYPTLFGIETSIGGDFKADLTIIDSKCNEVVLIELEDAKKSSIFLKRKNRSMKYWAPRLEVGFGQTIDWLCEIDLTKDKICELLNIKSIYRCTNVLVIGRSSFMTTTDQRRFEHRRKLIQDSSKRSLDMIDFDTLISNLQYEIDSHIQGNKAIKSFKKITL